MLCDGRIYETQEVYGATGDDGASHSPLPAFFTLASCAPSLCLFSSIFRYFCTAPLRNEFTRRPSLLCCQPAGEEADPCVVCQTEPRECIILPCRHCCLCYECAKDLTQTGSVQVEYGQVRRRLFLRESCRQIYQSPFPDLFGAHQ